MASTLRILRLFLRESHASRSNDEYSRRNPARLISKVDAVGNEKMITRSQFYQLALEVNGRQANVGDDVLPVPTLDDNSLACRQWLDWQHGAENNWRAVPLGRLPPRSVEYPSIRQLDGQGWPRLPSSNRQARSRFHRDLHRGPPCC